VGAALEQQPTILYVEDEAIIALPLIDVLEDAGFLVDHVGDGVAALAKLDEDVDRYVALVTDIQLPRKVLGWQIAHHARQLNPLMPVVYVSGDSASDWAANGVPESIMLSKPFANAQLVTALTTLLNEVAAIPGSQDG